LQCFFGGGKIFIFSLKPEKLCFQQVQRISVKKMALAYNSPDFEKIKKLKITRFLQQVPASSQKKKKRLK
jgi:hypothetical protein